MSKDAESVRGESSGEDGMLAYASGHGSYGINPWGLASAWADGTAQWLSVVFCPPLCLLAITFIATLSVQEGPAWEWLLVHALFAILLPLLYLARLFRGGMVSDLELNRRTERIRPLGAALSGTLASLAALLWGQAPAELVLVAGLSALQTGLFLLINLWWKISAHALTSTALAVMGFFMVGLAAMPLVFLAVLVAWSRVQLGAHTVSQTLAGAVLGGSLWILGQLTL